MGPRKYNGIDLNSSSLNGDKSNVLKIKRLCNDFIKEIIITREEPIAESKTSRFLSKGWIIQQWYGDTINIKGYFENYPIDTITITPTGMKKHSAVISIVYNKTIDDNGRQIRFKEEELVFHKLLDPNNPRPIFVTIYDEVKILGELETV